MAIVAPSPATLNARLQSDKLALEEQLRQVGREKREGDQRIAKLIDRNSELEGVVFDLQAHIKRLLGGRPHAEVQTPGQGHLFDDETNDLGAAIEGLMAHESDDEDLVELGEEDAQVPDAEEEETPKKKRPRNQRKVDESNLRREVKRSELSPEERRCPDTGVEMVETGVKITTELCYKKAELYLTEHHQVIYGPAPEIAQERTIAPVHAPAPEFAVEGVTANPTLLAWLLYQKYALHLPLYRQENAFAQLGVRLSRKTLCDWVLKSAFALRLVAQEIERQIRAGPVLQLDDTPIKVKRAGPGGGKKKVKQSYLWALRNPAVSGVVFRFTKGRSTEDVASLFEPVDELDGVEVIVGDGYSGNQSGVREAGLDVRHAGCWAHLLRKFRDALKEAPEAMTLYMKDIADLYAIEERGRKENLDPAAMLELRRRESLPIAVNMMRVTVGWQEHYSLQGKVAEALRYARGQRRALFAFLRDGRIPIDNNACERAIRPVAIGRRNWLFAGSVEGAQAAAVIYTLVESARSSRVDPMAYLEAVLMRLGSYTRSDLGGLTPWAMAAELPDYRTARDFD